MSCTPICTTPDHFRHIWDEKSEAAHTHLSFVYYPKMSSPRIPVTVIIFAAAFAALLILAALFPHPWLWGVNWWSGLSVVQLIAGIAIVAVCTLGALALVSWSEKADGVAEKQNIYWWGIVSTAAVLFAVVAWIFRSQSHYLGDGYALLTNIAQQHPIIKARNYGGTMLPIGIMSMLGEKTPAHALLAYQLSSALSGLLYIGCAGWLLARIYTRFSDRLVAFLVLLTAGNTLLFFGYVENYALWHVAVLFAIGTLWLALEKKLHWVVPIIAIAIALGMHALSIFLLAVALVAWLFLRQKKRGDVPNPPIVFLTGIGCMIAGIVVIQLIDKFARFSFLPVLTNEVTTDGYSLFALRHLADLGNLVLMLAPSLLLLLALPQSREQKSRSNLLLGVAVLSSLILVVTVNPWIGMPRDWDLLSVWVIPAALLVASVVNAQTTAIRRAAIVAVIGMQCCLLVPRVIAINTPTILDQHIERYISHDPSRNLTLRIIQQNLAVRAGDTIKADAIYQRYLAEYQEVTWMSQVDQLKNSGRLVEAQTMLDQVVRKNPMFAAAYRNLGSVQIQRGDQAGAEQSLATARGLNPYDPEILNLAGMLAFQNGNAKEADRLLNELLDIFPDRAMVRMNLVYLNKQQGDRARMIHHAKKLLGYFRLGKDGLTTQQMFEFVDFLGKEGMTTEGKTLLQEAASNGLDSTQVNELMRRHPSLAN